MTYLEFKEKCSAALKLWGLHSDAAVELLAMICAHESHGGKYRRQIGGGPALGIFQIEPPTHNDVWNRSRSISANALKAGFKRDKNKMAESDEYSIFVARHIIMLDPKPIPTEPDAMAFWCKKRWNTDEGKATADKYLNDWQAWQNGKI
jgi:hypothetical protein